MTEHDCQELCRLNEAKVHTHSSTFVLSWLEAFLTLPASSQLSIQRYFVNHLLINRILMCHEADDNQI